MIASQKFKRKSNGTMTMAFQNCKSRLKNSRRWLTKRTKYSSKKSLSKLRNSLQAEVVEDVDVVKEEVIAAVVMVLLEDAVVAEVTKFATNLMVKRKMIRCTVRLPTNLNVISRSKKTCRLMRIITQRCDELSLKCTIDIRN